MRSPCSGAPVPATSWQLAQARSYKPARRVSVSGALAADSVLATGVALAGASAERPQAAKLSSKVVPMAMRCQGMSVQNIAITIV